MSDQARAHGIRSSRWLAWGLLGVLVACAWAFLALMAYGEGWPSVIAALCTPGGVALTPTGLAAAFAMWAAMVLAMMLPSAAPMVATYMDIAGAAREKAMTVISPAMLIGGYLAVWLGVSVVASLAQLGLAAGLALSPSLGLASPGAAAAVLILAGAYQFSAAKAACLAKCRNPMSYFLGHWRDDPGGVFRIGLVQGLHCLGCCWALMAVMFAVGLMNLAWMALLAAVMVLEKILAEPRPLSRATGGALIALGVAAIML